MTWILTITRPRSTRGVTVVLLGLAVLLAACGGKSTNKNNSAKGTTGTPAAQVAQSSPTAAESPTATTSPTPSPTPSTPSPTPTETPDDSPMARLVIPNAKVDAKFVTLGIIAATNTMDSPKNKDDVGYYDFTPRPTYGGNTVLSGHVDWYTGQTGVFWYLKDLKNGDDIQIALQDGKTLHYTVTDTQLYDDADAPVDDILGDTPVESVTLITCEGVFNQAAAEYNKRRVIRAERVYS
jgi:LPXTG-site transpeptidase (sortase) family protein